MKDGIFALGLSEHRLWGLMFIPFVLKKSADQKKNDIYVAVSTDKSDPLYDNFSPEEKKITALIDEYNEQRLFRLFSKHKNVREFHEKVTNDRINDFIRPYIEKRLAVIFELAGISEIKFFVREKSITTLYDEDFLEPLTKKAEPVFHFTRNPEGSYYSLKIKINDENLLFKNQNTQIISNNPAIVRINRKIFSIRDIDAKKIKPFLLKDHITIPPQTEIKYFKTFVLNTIRDFEVNASGFRINIISPEKSAILSLEMDLESLHVLVLRFQYGKKRVLSNSVTKVFVDFHKEKDDFLFEKYYRDMIFEEKFHTFLTEKGLFTTDRNNYRVSPVKKGEESQDYGILEWVNRNSKEINSFGFITDHGIKGFKYFTGQLNIEMNTTTSADWFDIYANVKAGDYDIPFVKFRKNILNGIREYLLPNDEILILPAEWFIRYKELFEFCKTDRKIIKIHKQHFFLVEKLSSGYHHREVEKLQKLVSRNELNPAGVPHGLKATLRPYQLEGFTWLMYLQHNKLGGCLADDMGLGKTLQAISVLLKNKENHSSDKSSEMNVTAGQLSLFGDEKNQYSSLIVVPASLVHNWINEIRKFAPELKVYPHFGNQRVRKPGKITQYDITLTSYHTLRQDIGFFSGFYFHYVILDESQVIKNPDSKIYQAVCQLNADNKLVLTGTPVENSLSDLWAQMNFVNHGLLGNLGFFKKEYVYPIERKGEKNSAERLKKLINPFILRRTKEEVAKDLPDISDQVIYCSMTDEQRVFYEKEKSGIRNYIFESIEREGIEKSSFIVLQGLSRLRQISNHPVLVDPGYQYDSGKFEEIIRNAENVAAENHKALLFSSFVKHLKLFEDALKERNIRYEMLTGSSTKREDIIKAFRENEDCNLFLISLKAGGLGLNLTEADYVFILDPWWNPAAEQQAVSRSHRIGQENNVFVYRFISENSIEEKIQKLQVKKNKLAKAFITSNNPLKEISRGELEDLLC